MEHVLSLTIKRLVLTLRTAHNLGQVLSLPERAVRLG